MAIKLSLDPEILRHREMIDVACKEVRNLRNLIAKLFYDTERGSEMEQDILAAHSHAGSLLTVLEGERRRVDALLDNKPNEDDDSKTIH